MQDAYDEFWIRHGDLIKYLGPGHLDGMFLISFRYRFVLCATPKVGSSTLKAALHRMEIDAPDALETSWSHIHSPIFLSLLRPLQVQDLNRLFQNPSFVKFCFVRNPYDRILSCYMNKIWAPSAERTLILKALDREDEADCETLVTLEDFLTVVSSQELPYMDPHWCPQWYVTYQHAVPYDFIGRHERFDKDMHAIGRRLNPEFDRFVRDKFRNATGPKRYDFLTPKAVGLIQQIYEKDFTAFGYSFDPPCLAAGANG